MTIPDVTRAQKGHEGRAGGAGFTAKERKGTTKQQHGRGLDRGPPLGIQRGHHVASRSESSPQSSVKFDRRRKKHDHDPSAWSSCPHANVRVRSILIRLQAGLKRLQPDLFAHFSSVSLLSRC
jgi:hypothetical protein